MADTPPDVRQQIADRDRAARAAIFAADSVLIDNPGVRNLPGADQTRVTVTAALGYLIGHGLITVAQEADWPEWLSLDIPEHLLPDVDGMLARWSELPQNR